MFLPGKADLGHLSSIRVRLRQNHLFCSAVADSFISDTQQPIFRRILLPLSQPGRALVFEEYLSSVFYQLLGRSALARSCIMNNSAPRGIM